MIGTTLGRYRIVRRLGRGGMGEVWAAEDTRLKRLVALKLLPTEFASDPDRRSRFKREAETVAALDHPNIVTLYSLEEEDGLHFLTMQLVEGDRLDGVLASGPLSLDRLLRLAVQLADGVGAAHARGVVHRDLKPSNLILGTDDRLRILDFGLAKLRQTESADAAQTALETTPLTAAGSVLGTLPYMSPEQLAGDTVDERSDVFSLGVVLYEMAARLPKSAAADS